MVARVGGLTCSFNATVYEDTLDCIPDLVAWAQEHIDIVHVMVFICYREIELAQVWHHLRTGGYMAYAPPAMARRGRSMLLLLWPFDRGLRRALLSALLSPSLLFRRLYLQSIMIISPVDVLADGRQNMCDGCPDMTVWDGELAWSCRLEECIHFGQFARTVPKALA